MSVMCERRDQVLEIVLDRPPANAIDAATSQQLGEMFAEFEANPSLRVAIFMGAGDRFFSAGWDLKAAADGEAFDADFGIGGFGGFVELPNRTKPVIAAVNGAAVGGGFEIAMSADLVVAAEQATFSVPEALVGVIADVGTIRLPRLLPSQLANELLLTGRHLSAAEAKQWGLVNRVVAAPSLLDEGRALGAQVAAAAPLAVAAIIDLVERTDGCSFSDGLALMRSGQLESYERMLASKDAHEGPRAFAEKRSPEWQGR